MGGRGSGGHNSKGKLRDVQCARLDVHELAREGKLKLGSQGRLFGAIWFEVTGGPDAQHIVLEFPWRSASGEQYPVPQDILCYWRKAHYGGRYLMFSCPECYRPARVLYAWYLTHRIWFSVAGNAPISPISPQWATDGTARRVVSRSCALGSYGERTALCRSDREVCRKERTSESWGCWRTTRRCESRGRVTLQRQARSASCPFVAAMPK
jgi:hypothetical protein